MSGRRGSPGRRPDLSQHYLRSGALARSLVRQAGISSRDVVVEIGPGRGALTVELARSCGRLVAVEVDSELARLLRSRFEESENVSIVEGDFLRYGLPRGVPFKVVGNIPYARTSEIVRRVTLASNPPTDVHLIVQQEAAERYAGTPFAGESRTSLLLKPWWQVEISRRLRRADFEPPPAVDSVALWLARRARPLVRAAERSEYRSFIERVFGHGGNSVARSLRAVFSRTQLRRLARDLRLDEGMAPSELTFDQWLGLYRFHVLRARGG